MERDLVAFAYQSPIPQLLDQLFVGFVSSETSYYPQSKIMVAVCSL
jgi:hypothetical protein